MVQSLVASVSKTWAGVLDASIAFAVRLLGLPGEVQPAAGSSRVSAS
jgi:hypothetical protein